MHQQLDEVRTGSQLEAIRGRLAATIASLKTS